MINITVIDTVSVVFTVQCNNAA